MLIQACATMGDHDTAKRELRALEEAMVELRVDEATIVTQNEHDRIETAAGTVHVEPLWHWALDPRQQTQKA